MNCSASTSVRSSSPSDSGWRRQCPATSSPTPAAIGADLARLDGRPRPTVAWRWRRRDEPSRGEARPGTYDPDVVQVRSSTGRDQSTDRALPNPGRGRTAGDRRVAAGACRGHLAGAYIVRTIIDKLDREAVTVSDRGLRHGVLSSAEVGQDVKGRATARRTRHQDRDELANGVPVFCGLANVSASSNEWSCRGPCPGLPRGGWPIAPARRAAPVRCVRALTTADQAVCRRWRARSGASSTTTAAVCLGDHRNPAAIEPQGARAPATLLQRGGSFPRRPSGSRRGSQRGVRRRPPRCSWAMRRSSACRTPSSSMSSTVDAHAYHDCRGAELPELAGGGDSVAEGRERSPNGLRQPRCSA